MTERFSNQAVTTLSAAIATTTATTCTVTDATAFPTAGNFHIKIDGEILIVTGVAGTTFTISRGAEGTTAATHSSGATVIHLLTKAGLEARVANRFISDLYDNKPVAGVKGRLFLPTDGMFLEYDDGAAWHQYGPYRRLKAPPQTGWSWVNQGSATATFTGSALILEDPELNTTSPQVRLYMRWLNSGTTKLDMAFTYNGLATDTTFIGIAMRCIGGTDDGNFTVWGLRQAASSNYPMLHLQNYTSATAYEGSTPSFDGRNLWPARLFWFRFEWAGNYKRYYYSQDGVNWIKWYEQTFYDSSYPMQYGICIDPVNNAEKVSMSLVHWEES